MIAAAGFYDQGPDRVEDLVDQQVGQQQHQQNVGDDHRHGGVAQPRRFGQGVLLGRHDQCRLLTLVILAHLQDGKKTVAHILVQLGAMLFLAGLVEFNHLVFFTDVMIIFLGNP